MRHLIPLLMFGLLLTGLPPRAEPPTLRVATLEWPPYVGVGLPEQGLWAELMTEAARRMGRVAQIEFLPWSRALLQAERGLLDALMPAYHSAEREKSYDFSKPLPGGPVGLVARKADGLVWTSLADLRGKRLGVVRGYLNLPELDDDPLWIKDPAPDDLHSLRKLLLGRVDLVFIDRLVAAHLLRGELAAQAEELVDLGPELAQRDLHVMFPTGDGAGQTLCAEFDRQLEAMRADGSLSALFDKHRFGALLKPEARPEPPAAEPPR